jgi:hypothetical protein
MKDYNEIIKQYANNSISEQTAKEQLNALLSHYVNTKNKSIILKIRYCLLLITRHNQYKARSISTTDFLVFLRDYLLFVGRLQVISDIYWLVRSKGERYGIFTESNNYINAAFNLPRWFEDKDFVEIVYDKKGYNIVPPIPSVGDNYLYNNFKFKYYRSF